MCICAGGPTAPHILKDKDVPPAILPPSPALPFPPFSTGSFPPAHKHAVISPSFKNNLLTPLASLITTLCLCPLFRNLPGEVWELSLVPLLPFLLEAAPGSLLSPHSTEPALGKATRPSLSPSPKANPWSPSGLAHQHHWTQLSPPSLGSSQPSLSPLLCPRLPLLLLASQCWRPRAQPWILFSTDTSFLADLPWSWGFMSTTPQFLSPAWTLPLNFRF